jgi:simple sugar transport system ATP-binding protein
VLLVSEDLDELLELADRIAVISNGVIVHVTQARDADRAVLGHFMAGREAAAAR